MKNDYFLRSHFFLTHPVSNLLLPHPILLSISHPIDLKLLKKHFQMEPSWSCSQNRSTSKIQESMWLAAGWLQSIIVCCVSLEHSTGGDTMLILPARWLESASLRILGHFLPLLPPCVTNNGQVKHSPPSPWGHLAPSTVSTPGVSSWNIEIVGISSSPVQTYLFLFLSLSYVISKLP